MSMKRKDTKGEWDAILPKKKARNASQDSSPKLKPDAIDSIFSEKTKKKQLFSGGKDGKRTYPSTRQTEVRPTVVESSSNSGKEWVDDGLGGRFNHEGFTGRVEDGVKIFKAHLLNRPKAGTTRDCPFDCQCCFI